MSPVAALLFAFGALGAGAGGLRDAGDEARRPEVARALDVGADAGGPSDGPGDEETPDLDSADAFPSSVPDAGSWDGGALYTADLSDEELARRWKEDRASLGSISVGLPEAGRLINGVTLPMGAAWNVVVPEATYGTQEVVDALTMAATAVRAAFPQTAPLRINHLGKDQGGWLRPHQSHQSGRDADLGFYYRPGQGPSHFTGTRESALDPAANWALVKALIKGADVQIILVDFRVQRLLLEYARSQGEDPAWLDSLFHAGPDSLFQHVRRHRDHFHVRFYSPRAQELGVRLQKFLAEQQDDNVVIHRVVKGDSLGKIALRYGSTVKLIQKANGLGGTMLSVGRTLLVPVLGPCTRCPVPPPVVVPPRRLPPEHA